MAEPAASTHELPSVTCMATLFSPQGALWAGWSLVSHLIEETHSGFWTVLLRAAIRKWAAGFQTYSREAGRSHRKPFITADLLRYCCYSNMWLQSTLMMPAMVSFSLILEMFELRPGCSRAPVPPPREGTKTFSERLAAGVCVKSPASMPCMTN